MPKSGPWAGDGLRGGGLVTDDERRAWSGERVEMVRRQIAARGVLDERVLEAMRTVPREVFVPEHEHERVCMDGPLPIGHGQTISQPYIVALMLELLELKPSDRVLEVGSGSGYATAVMSRLVRSVVGIERHGDLAREASARLASLGYDTARIVHGDGTTGWAEGAPYDAILVSAAAGDGVPAALLGQLAVGGRLIVPVVVDEKRQRLVRVRRVAGDQYKREELGAVSFVPLVEGIPELGE
ncbi:MAG: protein-L-isoaspartate(D-aspartate) O-methyltransferase [Phycisphaeraceae bacterium]|nr:MAG: protein-L-isoaspartate(D-aspartate) O-methyltransferase [Phycisphaeraceae bacterium]